jgi:toxin ParE1/3/4
MKEYKLRFLPLFEDDLNQIVDYICFHLENPKAASELVAEIFEAINRRLPCAESFEAYPLWPSRFNEIFIRIAN